MKVFFICCALFQSLCSTAISAAPHHKTINLNGDHFFVDSFEGVMPERNILLKSHKHTPSKSHLYINHKQNLKVCVRSHTETRVHYNRGTRIVRYVTICDAYQTILSKYQTALELKRKNEGYKSDKNFELTFKQKSEGEALDYDIAEIKFGKKTIHHRKVKKNEVIFDYKQKSDFGNYLKNRLNFWDPKELQSASYFSQVSFDSKSRSKNFSQENFEPVVKEITISTKDIPSQSQKKPLLLTVEYFGLEEICLQKENYIHDGKEKRKCIALGFKPKKMKQTLSLSKKKSVRYADNIKILIAQKYMKAKELKVHVEGANDWINLKTKIRTKKGVTSILIK